MDTNLAKMFGCIALPFMATLGGCASTREIAPPQTAPLTTASTTRAAFTAQQSALLNQSFNDTVYAFEKMGFGWKTGPGPRAQQDFCRTEFPNGYTPCDVVTDASIKAIVPYGTQSADGVNGLINQDIIRSLNIRVNAAILPMEDQDKYGVIDEWSFGRPRGVTQKNFMPDASKLTRDSLEGDCEDYSLLKQYLLRRNGIASHLTIVRDADGAGHMVLTVLTDQGPLILDNQEYEPRLWKETIYAQPGHTHKILNFWQPTTEGWHKFNEFPGAPQP